MPPSQSLRNRSQCCLGAIASRFVTDHLLQHREAPTRDEPLCKDVASLSTRSEQPESTRYQSVQTYSTSNSRSSLYLSPLQRSLGWGKTGHAVVAGIAEANLTPVAATEVRRLLAVEGYSHLSNISSWADKAKAEQLPGSPSHTIRLPIDGSTPRPHPCPGHFCANDALAQYGATLADRSKPDAEREVALKYIVHLVGDLHQPLHGTDATGQMQVLFLGKQMTLHAVWDDGIINAHGKNASKLTAELMKADKNILTDGTPIDWAREDLDIAQHQIYDTVSLHPTSVVILPPDYARAKWPIVQLRLTEGGLRLASLLNHLLS